MVDFHQVIRHEVTDFYALESIVTLKFRSHIHRAAQLENSLAVILQNFTWYRSRRLGVQISQSPLQGRNSHEQSHEKINQLNIA